MGKINISVLLYWEHVKLIMFYIFGVKNILLKLITPVPFYFLMYLLEYWCTYYIHIFVCASNISIGSSVGKESAYNAGDLFDSWIDPLK